MNIRVKYNNLRVLATVTIPDGETLEAYAAEQGGFIDNNGVLHLTVEAPEGTVHD